MRTLLLKSSIILVAAALLITLIPHSLLCDSESHGEITYNHDICLTSAGVYHFGVSTAIPAKKTKPDSHDAVHVARVSPIGTVTWIINRITLPLPGSPARYLHRSRATFS